MVRIFWETMLPFLIGVGVLDQLTRKSDWVSALLLFLCLAGWAVGRYLDERHSGERD